MHHSCMLPSSLPGSWLPLLLTAAAWCGRQVDIWEDRKVFGHKDETLRVLLLGPELATPALASAAGLTAAAQEPPGQALKGGEGPSTGASTGATKGEAAETSRRPSPGGAREQADEGVPSSSAPPRPPQHQDSSPRSHSPSHRPKVRAPAMAPAEALSKLSTLKNMHLSCPSSPDKGALRDAFVPGL